MADRLDTSYRLADRLRDIHVPETIDWWPPAPGWWLAAVLVPALLIILAWIWRRKGALRREALREMGRTFSSYQTDGDRRHLAAGLSALMKRVAMARDGRAAVAALSGEAWLAYLDARSNSTDFTDGPGRLLASLPYAQPPEEAPAPKKRGRRGDDDIRDLMGLVRQWLLANT